MLWSWYLEHVVATYGLLLHLQNSFGKPFRWNTFQSIDLSHLSCKESCGNSNPESVNGDPLEVLLDGEGDVRKYILVAGDSDSCAIVESSDCFFVIAGRCEIISVSIALAISYILCYIICLERYCEPSIYCLSSIKSVVCDTTVIVKWILNNREW